MTLPIEEVRSMVNARRFLHDLLDPKVTPKVPKAVRTRARDCLNHYPWEFYKEFTVTSRYGHERLIRNIEDRQYILVGKSEFVRAGQDFIDYEGGPFLRVGDDFYGLGPIKALKPINSGSSYVSTQITLERLDGRQEDKNPVADQG